MSHSRRKNIVDPDHVDGLSITGQCRLLSINWSSYYYRYTGETPLNLELMRLIDAQFFETPCCGARQMARQLHRLGYCVSRKRISRLMRVMGLSPIYQRPNTSKPHPDHKIYPYPLRGMTIDAPNRVRYSDITYIPMRRGFLYLVAIMDRADCKVLSRRFSNTLDTEFCVAALEEALARYGRPEIFNTDQGSRFTSIVFTNVLKDAGIKISMDGKGRWMDNVMRERLWRSLKYECVYLNAYETGSEVQKGIGCWLSHYNKKRPHSSLNDKTPHETYRLKPRAGYHSPATIMAA